MTRRILLAALWMASMATAHAQMNDEFNTNDFGWNEYMSKEKEVIIRDGKMHLESKSESETMTFCYAPFDPAMNFDIKCDVMVKKIDEDNTFGVLLDYQDDDNYVAFMVTEGKARFERWKEGKLVGRFWATIKMREQKRAKVALQLIGESQKVAFYVNGVKAFERRYLPIESCGVGFKIGGKQKVDFDNLEITQ